MKFGSKITFINHVNYVRSKTIGKIKLLGRISRHHGDSIQDSDLSIFDYCDYVYYILSDSCKDVLQRLQNRALKNIIQVYRRTPTRHIHSEVELPMLNVRREIHVENLYEFINYLGPPKCCSMFSPVNEHHNATMQAYYSTFQHEE